MDSFTPKQSLFDRIGGRAALRELVRHFYADVRQHRLIGPVFEDHVEDWPTHIEKITDFWSGVTGGPAHYRGPMPLKHLPLGLEESHFEAWLGLWRRKCRTRLEEREAKEMEAIAEMIGQRLRQIIARHSTGDDLM